MKKVFLFLCLFFAAVHLVAQVPLSMNCMAISATAGQESITFTLLGLKDCAPTGAFVLYTKYPALLDARGVTLTLDRPVVVSVEPGTYRVMFIQPVSVGIVGGPNVTLPNRIGLFEYPIISVGEVLDTPIPSRPFATTLWPPSRIGHWIEFGVRLEDGKAVTGVFTQRTADGSLLKHPQMVYEGSSGKSSINLPNEFDLAKDVWVYLVNPVSGFASSYRVWSAEAEGR